MAFMSRSIRKAGRGNPPCAGLLAVAMAACLAGTARSAGDQDLFAPAASDNAVLQWDNALLQAVRATIPYTATSDPAPTRVHAAAIIVRRRPSAGAARRPTATTPLVRPSHADVAAGSIEMGRARGPRTAWAAGSVGCQTEAEPGATTA